MNSDLKRSGITPAQGKKLKYKELSQAQTKKLTGENVKSYRIPYLDIHGKDTGFFRVRYLAKVKPPFAKDAKPIRYWQPPNTMPHIYFPPIEDWKTVISDTGIPIHITEGEKKAAKACVEGIPCIGLGGVWSWRSVKEGISFLDELEGIEWEDRDVGMVFDNDMNTNPHVMQALYALSRELVSRGARVFMIYLPDGEEKMGLDDYLLKNTAEDFDKLPFEEIGEGEELWALNREVAYIEDVAAYLHIKTGKLLRSPNALIEGPFANRRHQIVSIDKDGNKKFRTVHTAKEWSTWRCRRTHTHMDYIPGEQRVSGTAYNTWKGWGVQPEKGDVKPVLDLIDHLFQNAKPEEKKWFMQWLAYPIQNAGMKMATAVLLYSGAHGVGKSFIGYIMGDIYGVNFNAVGQEDIQGAYNDWCVGKQFILGEELIGGDRRAEADKVKNMVTREIISVNKKYEPSYNVPDCANYLFTSNHCNAMFLERADRRVFVHEVTAEVQSDDFYERIDRWRKNDGAAAFMWYLENKVDCSDFNPKSAAPMTESKLEMIDISRSDLDNFCSDLQESPEGVLTLGGSKLTRDLFTSEELLNIYDPNNEHRATTTAMSRALKRTGFKRRPTRVSSQTKKLWVVRNEETWLKRKGTEWAAHYEEKLKVLNTEKGRKF